MKRNWKAAVLVAVSCFVALLSGCAKWERAESFERYFAPEGYDPGYSVMTERLCLEGDTAYRLQLDAECERGTIEIHVAYGTEVQYEIDSVCPCHQVIEVPADAADMLLVSLTVSPDTEGKVFGELQQQIP